MTESVPTPAFDKLGNKEKEAVTQAAQSIVVAQEMVLGDAAKKGDTKAGELLANLVKNQDAMTNAIEEVHAKSSQAVNEDLQELKSPGSTPSGQARFGVTVLAR